jgi:hypothetical protein
VLARSEDPFLPTVAAAPEKSDFLNRQLGADSIPDCITNPAGWAIDEAAGTSHPDTATEVEHVKKTGQEVFTASWREVLFSWIVRLFGGGGHECLPGCAEGSDFSGASPTPILFDPEFLRTRRNRLIR